MKDLESKYPLIWAVYNRESKVTAAAKLLEEAGMEEQALQALEKISFSPLEKEVIQLVKELG